MSFRCNLAAKLLRHVGAAMPTCRQVTSPDLAPRSSLHCGRTFSPLCAPTNVTGQCDRPSKAPPELAPAPGACDRKPRVPALTGTAREPLPLAVEPDSPLPACLPPVPRFLPLLRPSLAVASVPQVSPGWSTATMTHAPASGLGLLLLLLLLRPTAGSAAELEPQKPPHTC